jgi:hypothetical protein
LQLYCSKNSTGNVLFVPVFYFSFSFPKFKFATKHVKFSTEQYEGKQNIWNFRQSSVKENKTCEIFDRAMWRQTKHVKFSTEQCEDKQNMWNFRQSNVKETKCVQFSTEQYENKSSKTFELSLDLFRGGDTKKIVIQA